MLTLNLQSNAIEVQLKAGGAHTAGSLFPLQARLRLLAQSALSQHFPSLHYALLMSPPGTDEWFEHSALSAELDSTDVVLSSGECVPVRTLREGVAPWLRPPVPPQEFHLFLSYQHTDAPFTNLIYDCCAAADGIDTFLDRSTLSIGTPLGTACMLALSHTRVIVPIVTCAVLRRLSTLGAESGLSYVLLEWTFAALLHQLHGYTIMPIFVGAGSDGADAFDHDLFAARPPRAGPNGVGDEIGADGKPVPDHRPLVDRVPDVKVNAVREELESFFKHHEAALPAEAEQLTAAAVVKLICKMPGLTTWASTHRSKEHSAALAQQDWGLHEALADELVVAARKTAAPPKRLARPAYEDGVADSLKEYLDQQFTQLKQGQGALKQGQADLKRGQDEIKKSLASIAKSVSGISRMVAAVLKGEHDCPRWMLVVPVQPPEGAMQRAAEWFKPAHWLKNKVLIIFVCPVTMTAVGEGFEVELTKDWVKQYGPAFRFGMTIFKTLKGAGIEIPVVSGAMKQLHDASTNFLSDTLAGLDEQLDKAGLSAVSALADQAVGQLQDQVDGFFEGLPVLEAAEAGSEEAGAEDEAEVEEAEAEEEEAEEDMEVPDQKKEPVQRSYATVVALLDSLASKDESISGVTAAEKRAALLGDTTRCVVAHPNVRMRARPLPWQLTRSWRCALAIAQVRPRQGGPPTERARRVGGAQAKGGIRDARYQGLCKARQACEAHGKGRARRPLPIESRQQRCFSH